MTAPRPAPPSSTYRLQLHAEFDFDAAAAVVDYLAALGVGHIYTSPVLQAAPGSMHGYDVVDHSRANDELGGEAGRIRLADAASRAGMGTVLDIVPNHMSVAVPRLNRWWWDVLAHGRASAYASYFDIDWDRGPLLLPVLGDAENEEAAIEVVDGQLAYYDHRFPIAAGTVDGTTAQVHARQHYRLVNWRRGNSELTYRRFFDITDLAGLRVEDERVFADTHREVLRWVAAGEVDGLRIDHPDGLADPGGYLDRLADAAPHAWIVVEKILESGPAGDEALPPSWRCAGTTGYDALRLICGVFVDGLGEPGITELQRSAGGEPAAEAADAEGIAALCHDLQVTAATTVLRAESERLARALVAEHGPIDHDTAVAVIAEAAAALPVYRTYLPTDGEQFLRHALAGARERRPDLTDALDVLDRAARDASSEFATRWQQTTGMVMAKGVEDTAFYRANRFVALNEVGGDPASFGVTVEDFHGGVVARAGTHPDAMTSLSTHDTKRSEDVRARLAVLAEIPEVWAGAVRTFTARHRPPDQNLGSLAWQSLVGAWPIDPDRFGAYLEKASREAKEFTSWTDADPDYDRARNRFVADVFADDAAIAEVAEFVARITPFGWSNALGQKLLALAMPGVPDVYQGTELWDLSLVDPDNRRPVDYARRRTVLAELDAAGAPPAVDDSGAAKLWITSRALRARRAHPELFAGGYAPLYADGAQADHLVGFARTAERSDRSLIALATRLPARLHAAGGWDESAVTLPAGEFVDLLAPEDAAPLCGSVPLRTLFARLPVALLVRRD